MRGFHLQLLIAVATAQRNYDWGGSDWGEDKCRNGKQQSPVDVHHVTKSQNLEIHLDQGYNYYNSTTGRTTYNERYDI